MIGSLLELLAHPSVQTIRYGEGGSRASLSDALLILGPGLLLVGAVTYLLTSRLSARRARDTQRLDILDKALDHSDLDAETRAQLVELLAEEHRRGSSVFLFRPSFWSSAAFVLGWMLFVFCGGLLLLDMFEVVETIASRRDRELVWLWGLASLGLLSLPVALRERRRRLLVEERRGPA